MEPLTCPNCGALVLETGMSSIVGGERSQRGTCGGCGAKLKRRLDVEQGGWVRKTKGLNARVLAATDLALP